MVRLGSWVLFVTSTSLACGGRTDSLDFDDGSSAGGSTSGGHATGGTSTATGGLTATTGGTRSTTGGTRSTTGGTLTITGGVTATSGGTVAITGGRPNPASGGVPSTGGTTPSNTGGTVSAGSGGVGVPRCVPGASMSCACADGLLGAQRCNADGFYDSCQCDTATLERFRQQIVGKWIGTRQSPWDGAPNVTLDLTAEGTWSGSCSGSNPIFYWGDYPGSGRYRLVSVNTDPEAFGELSVQFGPTSQQGALRHIRFNADQSQLKFEFWRTWGGEYGPLEFDLHRP